MPSRPARALRVAAVGFTVLLAIRLPVMRARFDAAMSAGAGAAAGVEGPTSAARAMRVAFRAKPRQPARPASASVVAAIDRTGAAADQRRNDAGGVRRFALAVAGQRTDPAATARSQRGEASAGPAAPVAPSAAVAATTPFDPRRSVASSPPVTTLAVTVSTAASGPGALASAAYARLAGGDRRGAVRLFDAALGDAPDTADARAQAWRHQRDALTRRWSGAAYSIVRASGPAGLTTEPVLGGGQSGGAIAFAADPLSRRPVAVTLRGSAGHDDAGRSAFTSIGVEWRPFTGVTLAAERRVAIGPAARDDWTLRLAAGADRTRGRLHVTAYGEGGIVGAATYAALQARVAGVVRDGAVTFEPGIGGWASRQHDHGTVDRVDLGPGVVVRAGGLALEVDYRARVAGNAAPGSGPVLTLSAAF